MLKIKKSEVRHFSQVECSRGVVDCLVIDQLLNTADFRYHLKNKDQVHIEVKIKNARYIGEVTKVSFLATDPTSKIISRWC